MSLLVKIHSKLQKGVRLLFRSNLDRYQAIKERALGKLESLPIMLEDQAASNEIEQLIMSGLPVMVARLGANEINAVLNYRYIKETPKAKKIINFILFEKIWWWDELQCQGLCNNAGFFPYTPANMDKFSELMISSMRNVDLLGAWVPGENRFKDDLGQAKICRLQDLEPYYHKNPWSAALKGKNVLVIHPFSESIKKQYNDNREKLFKNPDVLPEFNLLTLKAVQSIAGNKTGYQSWFEALDWMTNEISRINFDVAIIGCGAYGFPLASRIKDLGKQAIHLGGATQILFGIKGRRWDTHPVISSLYNQFWIRPDSDEVPDRANSIEDSCYW